MSIPSAEVAADFKDALQDLKVNSRPEISNLTIIAKENTEHAQAISRELETHIRTTRPEWKLPALYVLDSIVKNVGTPYTVYLGRDLYRTFMDAYVAMDPGHRRAMEGLLKTWKQPVPESMDTRPVFQHEVTRDIENALNKIRNVTVQQQALSHRQPHGLPARPASNPMGNGPWRNTPTPPQNGPRYAAPNDPRVRQSFPQTAQAVTPQQFSPPISSTDLETLKADLAKLIFHTKSTSELNPSDSGVGEKLNALMNLQTVLNTQTIPPQSLQTIRQRIQELSPQPVPVQTFPPAASFQAQPFVNPPQQPVAPLFPMTGSPFDLTQILANARLPVPQTSTPVNPTQSLADLLRRVSTPQQTSSTPTAMPSHYPPPPLPVVPQPIAPTPAPMPIPAPTPTNNLAELLASLNKPAAAPAPQLAPPLPSQPQLFPQQLAAAPASTPDWLLNALKGLPQLAAATPLPQSTPTASTPMSRQTSSTMNAPGIVELTTASMKQPRFHLISKLYSVKPNTCATCGRRFESTPEGKQKKARHMDWHFKVKDPDAAKRGVHRSWYISEKEWVEYREVDESSPEQVLSSSKGAGVAAKKEPKDKYVRVPTDPSLHAPCPICQERFDQNMKWHVEANDFVWMDAVNVNGKIYHATCWDEYNKGAGIPTPSTPDSVLGKRKADPGTPASGKKVRAY